MDREGQGQGMVQGMVLGGASSTAWTAPFQRTPEFAEGTSTSVGGPSSSKSVPRESSNPKVGVMTKNRENLWAPKTIGSLKHIDKATSSPIMNRVSFGSNKEASVSKELFSSPGPSHRTHKDYPSSMKDKKAIARNLASGTNSTCAVNFGLQGLARKLTTLAPTLSPSPCLDPKQLESTTFEFSATSYTENRKNVGSESDQRIDAHHIGEKRIFSTSDAPSYSHKERYEGNREINPQANVGA